MSQKLKVGIVFGGRSAEHQVSLQSAKSIVAAIDRDKYEPVLIGITHQGQWLHQDASDFLLNGDNPKTIALSPGGTAVALVASDRAGQVMSADDRQALSEIDVLFPVLHGPYGEDGSIQGLAKLANIPCVGSGILGSAVGMDKDFAKRLLLQAGLKVADFEVIYNGQLAANKLEAIENRLQYPVFVKPANMGSSIGVSKADNREALLQAVAEASRFDRKVLVEEAIKGREIECAILGNDEPEASVCGEIAAAQSHSFYDYDAKYIDDAGAELSIPANISDAAQAKIQQIAKQVFQTLELRGLTRVDVFLTADEEVYINEVNTLPGFTRISMYPKLWQYSGVSYADLVDRLIQLAIADYQDANR